VGHENVAGLADVMPDSEDKTRHAIDAARGEGRRMRPLGAAQNPLRVRNPKVWQVLDSNKSGGFLAKGDTAQTAAD
jgi:hypothetical protein